MAVLSCYRNKNAKLDWATRKKILKMVWWFRRKEGYIYFVRGIMGLRTAPHQRICLRSFWTSPTAAGILSRGASKTTMEAIIITSRGMLYPSYNVQTVAGGSFKQTKQTMQYAEKMIKGTIVGQTKKEYFKKALPKKDKVINKSSNSDWSITISNSVINGLAVEGENRGFRANTLSVGEANDVKKEILTTVFEPFMTVQYDPMSVNVSKTRLETLLPKAKDMTLEQNFILQTGTITYDFTSFWHWCQSAKEKVIEYVNEWLKKERIKELITDGFCEYCFEIYDYEDTYIGEKGGWADTTKKGWNNPRIDHQYYKMDLKKILGALDKYDTDVETWKAEYKNIVIASSGREFSPELMYNSYKNRSGIDARTYPRFASDQLCVWGIDPARSENNAEFAVSIVGIGEEYNNYLYGCTEKGMEYGNMTDKIIYLTKLFPNTMLIGMDSGGGGTAIRDNLRDRRFIPIPDPFIIDSDDPHNQILILGSYAVRSTLKMLTPNAEKNTIWNKFLKLKKQMTSVEMEGVGNFFTYFVKNGNKDLYSSMVYAGAMLQLYLQLYRNVEENGDGSDYGAAVSGNRRVSN